MMRMVLVTTLVAGVVACEKHEEPRPAAKPYAGHPRTLHGAQPAPSGATPAPSGATPSVAPSGGKAEVRLGNATGEPPHLAFRIVKVYDAQKPTGDGLGHAAGGTWQFFDAVTADGAPFTFGCFAPPAKGEVPMSFGDFVLATADRARFVASLAKGFGQEVPAAARAERKGKPIRARLVVLGRNQKQMPGGGYGDGGTATATKLFFESGGADAEVFFNFDVAGKSGEFSEKDADYDKELVGITAAGL